MRAQLNNQSYPYDGYPPQDFRYLRATNLSHIGGADDPLSPDELMQLEQMGALFSGGVQISE